MLLNFFLLFWRSDIICLDYEMFVEYLTSSTELSPSRYAASCALIQEMPSILLNPKVHYSVYKSPLRVAILSQIKPIHTIPSYLFKIHLNITKLTFSSTQTQRTSQQNLCFLHNVNISLGNDGIFSCKPTTEYLN
jgi:hypothetical protein